MTKFGAEKKIIGILSPLSLFSETTTSNINNDRYIDIEDLPSQPALPKPKSIGNDRQLNIGKPPPIHSPTKSTNINESDFGLPPLPSPSIQKTPPQPPLPRSNIENEKNVIEHPSSSNNFLQNPQSTDTSTEIEDIDSDLFDGQVSG